MTTFWKKLHFYFKPIWIYYRAIPTDGQIYKRTFGITGLESEIHFLDRIVNNKCCVTLHDIGLKSISQFTFWQEDIFDKLVRYSYLNFSERFLDDVLVEFEQLSLDKKQSLLQQLSDNNKPYKYSNLSDPYYEFARTAKISKSEYLPAFQRLVGKDLKIRQTLLQKLQFSTSTEANPLDSEIDIPTSNNILNNDIIVHPEVWRLFLEEKLNSYTPLKMVIVPELWDAFVNVLLNAPAGTTKNYTSTPLLKNITEDKNTFRNFHPNIYYILKFLFLHTTVIVDKSEIDLESFVSRFYDSLDLDKSGIKNKKVQLAYQEAIKSLIILNGLHN